MARYARRPCLPGSVFPVFPRSPLKLTHYRNGHHTTMPGRWGAAWGQGTHNSQFWW
jgi:hypothetical protein